MLWYRDYEYKPTEEEKKTNLSLEYSEENGLLIDQYKYYFIRKCDRPYTEFAWHKVKEHLLLIQYCTSFDLDYLNLYIEEYQERWYFVIGNPQSKKSVPDVFHLHLIKIED